MDQMRCVRCGDVIGVYEPLVLLLAGVPHETSRAAGDDLPSDSPVLHLECQEHGAVPVTGREA